MALRRKSCGLGHEFIEHDDAPIYQRGICPTCASFKIAKLKTVAPVPEPIVNTGLSVTFIDGGDFGDVELDSEYLVSSALEDLRALEKQLTQAANSQAGPRKKQGLRFAAQLTPIRQKLERALS